MGAIIIKSIISCIMKLMSSQNTLKRDRWLARTVREICVDQGINFRSLSHDWLWELRKGKEITRVLGFTFDLNSSAASNIGRDKVAAYELMKTYGIPAVPHSLARMHHTSTMDDTEDWSQGVVIKPLTGQGGDEVHLFYDSQKGYRYMLKSKLITWALSPLQDVEREIRVIFLDGEVILTYAKQPVIIKGLRIFNLSKGATPIDHTLTHVEEKLSRDVQELFGLRLVAVDIVELKTGELKVLEVNSAITMEKYVQFSQANEHRARVVYEKIIKAALFEV